MTETTARTTPVNMNVGSPPHLDPLSPSQLLSGQALNMNVSPDPPLVSQCLLSHLPLHVLCTTIIIIILPVLYLSAYSMWNEFHSMWTEPHSMWNPCGMKPIPCGIHVE